MTAPLVDVRGLSKTYTRRGERIRALRMVSLTIRPGEVVGLLGPNGSGKSTFVKAISGLLEPDAGSVLWRGSEAGRREISGELGLLLEGRGAANERLSTLENARYFCTLREREFRLERFNQLVAQLGIPDAHCPIRLFSTGLRLRASLLVTLIHEPSLVLLDEPTLGLDVPGVDQLERMILDASSRGVSFLVSSHDLHFIGRLCRRIACLHTGEVIFDGSRDEFARQDHLYRAVAKTRSSEEATLFSSSWAWRSRGQGEFELNLTDNLELSRFLRDIHPHIASLDHFEIRSIDLREKYLRMLEEHSRVVSS